MSSHPQTTAKRVPWGYLVWTLPLAYVFWAPYQHGTGLLEWAITALTLVAVLTLFLTGLTFDHDPKVVAYICVALLVIATAALAYRPAAGLYFPVAAACVAPAMAGRVRGTLALVALIAALFGAQWSLLYLRSEGPVLPLLVTGQILVSGVGALFAVRQQQELQRREQVNERERIAKDLHDVLGHSLSSLALKAELARRVFYSDPARARRDQRRGAHCTARARRDAQRRERLLRGRRLRRARARGIAARGDGRERGATLRAARDAARERASARVDRTRSFTDRW